MSDEEYGDIVDAYIDENGVLTGVNSMGEKVVLGSDTAPNGFAYPEWKNNPAFLAAEKTISKILPFGNVPSFLPGQDPNRPYPLIEAVADVVYESINPFAELDPRGFNRQQVNVANKLWNSVGLNNVIDFETLNRQGKSLFLSTGATLVGALAGPAGAALAGSLGATTATALANGVTGAASNVLYNISQTGKPQLVTSAIGGVGAAVGSAVATNVNRKRRAAVSAVVPETTEPVVEVKRTRIEPEPLSDSPSAVAKAALAIAADPVLSTVAVSLDNLESQNQEVTLSTGTANKMPYEDFYEQLPPDFKSSAQPPTAQSRLQKLIQNNTFDIDTMYKEYASLQSKNPTVQVSSAPKLITPVAAEAFNLPPTVQNQISTVNGLSGISSSARRTRKRSAKK